MASTVFVFPPLEGTVIASTVYEAIRSDNFPRFFGQFGDSERISRNEIINYILTNNLAS